MSARQKCGDCKHWEAGQCLRFPPIAVPTPQDNQLPALYFPEPWQPSVGAEHPACGEFAKVSP